MNVYRVECLKDGERYVLSVQAENIYHDTLWAAIAEQHGLESVRIVDRKRVIRDMLP